MNRNDTTKTSFEKQCDTIKHNRVRKTNTTTPGANITAVVDASSSHAVGAPVAILDEPAVEELTSLSRTTRWRMERRVAYLIIENSLTEHAEFTYWRESDQAQQFQSIFHPAVIPVDYRLPDLENATRNHGVTLGEVSSRSTNVPELRRASLVMRAQSYCRRMFQEFDRVKELLLP
jgi:hypothetical protein